MFGEASVICLEWQQSVEVCGVDEFLERFAANGYLLVTRLLKMSV